jgi:hypothetical protein
MFNEYNFVAVIRVIFTYDFIRTMRILERPTRHSNAELTLWIAL